VTYEDAPGEIFFAARTIRMRLCGTAQFQIGKQRRNSRHNCCSAQRWNRNEKNPPTPKSGGPKLLRGGSTCQPASLTKNLWIKPALHLYMAQKKLRPRSRVEIDRHLFKNCAPLHRMPLTAITRADVAKMLEAVTEQSGEIQANRTRASLSAFFVWAWRRGMVENNPVLATHRHSEVSRDRVLSDPEIRRIWHALPESDFGRALRVLLLTGQRRREIAHLRWSEVDLARGVIELPAERTKNGRAHQVPITAPVRSILEAQPRSGDQVFAPANWEVRKAELDAALPLEPHWVVHDLRRTCATRMADLGIQPHVIEAVLNHMRGHRSGVAGVYNRALYATEKAQALARWAEHVTALVEGRPAAVVQLKQA
jgi:integrase